MEIVVIFYYFCEYCLRVFPPFFFDMTVKYFFINSFLGYCLSIAAAYPLIWSPEPHALKLQRDCPQVIGDFAKRCAGALHRYRLFYSSKNRITQLRISSSWLRTYTQLQSEIRERATYNCPCVNGSLSNISPTRAIVCP